MELREQVRLQEAHLKNLEYLRRQDEGTTESSSSISSSSVPNSRKRGKKSRPNSSVYVTGLETYMACKQLEGLCNRIGKVRRIKFYKNEKGGLKGDALITFFWRNGILDDAIERLDDCEIKPGVFLRASAAEFQEKTSSIASGATTPAVFSEQTSTTEKVTHDESSTNSEEKQLVKEKEDDSKLQDFLSSLE